MRVIKSGSRVLVRVALVAFGAAALVSCNETTPPVNRYPLLDDVGASNWQAVSSGGDHTCALKTDGTAYCWGSNKFGQLGNLHSDTICGTPTTGYPCQPTPQRVTTDVKFVAISSGLRHTCGITKDREAYCWGANDQSQVAGFTGSGPTLSRIPGALPWTQISAGATHTCAVRSDGALFCWGQSERGEIGNGSLTNANTPTLVTITSPVAAVSAGESRTCARTTVGTVYCWGAIWTSRQGGLEVSRAQTRPQLVPNAPAMSSLSVGSFTTCGADMSGFAYCWEANPRGGMGNGSFDGSLTPQRVLSDEQFVQVSAGIVQTCGVTVSGAGYCWGDDSFGQLGVATINVPDRCGDGTLPCISHPLAVIGRQAFTDISTGFGSHSCGITTRGNLYCWGLGASGQRGDGRINGSGVFTPITVKEPKA